MKNLLLLFAFFLPSALFASNAVPTAKITLTPDVAVLNNIVYQDQTITFSAFTSYDNDSGGCCITGYEWRLGSNAWPVLSSSVSFAYTFSGANGLLTIEMEKLVVFWLRVRDNENTWSAWTSISVRLKRESTSIYYITDHIGNVRATVDHNGNLLGYDDYDPFGLVMPGRSANVNNPKDLYKFTGHERDAEIGLDFMLARNYDPEIGRFLSVDPHHFNYPSMSSYAYALNNPIVIFDPLGLDTTYVHNAKEVEVSSNKITFSGQSSFTKLGGEWAALFYAFTNHPFGRNLNGLESTTYHRINGSIWVENSKNYVSGIAPTDLVVLNAIKAGASLKSLVTNLKELKQLIKTLSKEELKIKLSKKLVKELDELVKTYGGSVRHDLNPIKGKERWGPHIQVEKLGSRIENRHIKVELD